MIIIYLSIISTILFFTVFLLLIYLGIIFKNTKLYNFLKSKLFSTFVKNVLLAILTLFLTATLIFIITEIMPKNYFSNIISGDVKTPIDDSNFINKLLRYYLDILPFPKKICSISHLENNQMVCSKYEYKLINLNNSYIYMRNTPVEFIIKDRTKISFIIGIIAYFFQCLIGYPLAIHLAKRENKPIDKTFSFLNASISIIPSIIYFYLFVIIFMVVLKLPVTFDSTNILSYLAPLTALTINSSIYIAYFLRKYILIELNKDYVKFAKSKGLSDNAILYKHVLRNAMIPFIRTIPTSILMCFCGFYLLESAFNIPGIGLTLINAIKFQDIYLIRGILLYFSILYIISYLISDLVANLYNKKSIIKEDIKNE